MHNYSLNQFLNNETVAVWNSIQFHLMFIIQVIFSFHAMDKPKILDTPLSTGPFNAFHWEMWLFSSSHNFKPLHMNIDLPYMTMIPWGINRVYNVVMTAFSLGFYTGLLPINTKIVNTCLLFVAIYIIMTARSSWLAYYSLTTRPKDLLLGDNS